MRKLKFRKPWYTPTEPLPFEFELEVVFPLDSREVHLLGGDKLTLTSPNYCTEWTAPQSISIYPGDTVTVIGQVIEIETRTKGQREH